METSKAAVFMSTQCKALNDLRLFMGIVVLAAQSGSIALQL